mmetsp:Transcript_26306/g.59755  ORF Transcript_26306/g.59755 Transcript_26306/m.59755 type:complete len:181 (+) Transcript_26306:500-1042(+)
MFTIMKRLHEYSKDHEDVMKAFNYFKQMLLQHSLANTPDCVELYSPTDVKMITQFVHSTFLQHYRLYRFANTRDQEKDQFSTCLYVNTAASPPPLASGKIDDGQSKAQASVVGEQQETSQQQNEEAKAEDKQEEETSEARVAKAVSALLAEKSKELEDSMQKKLDIKMNTIQAKLAGLGL